jgi:hypothetical protein
VRLVLHTGAYWLLLKVRDNIPKPQPLAVAEIKNLQTRLIKIAARITETATRVRIAFAATWPRSRSVQRLGPQLPTGRTVTDGGAPPQPPVPKIPNAHHFRSEFVLKTARRAPMSYEISASSEPIRRIMTASALF